jgi:hypothetical protein
VAQGVIRRVETIEVEDEIVWIVFLHASHGPPDVVVPRYFQSIAGEDIIMIGVIARDLPLKAPEFRHGPVHAHRLRPPMSEGPFCR